MAAERRPRSALRGCLCAAVSVLCSAAAVASVGSFCALFYPLLRDLRGEKVRGENGTEERVLSLPIILVLSVLIGWIICTFSWTLTYIDSKQPDPALWTLEPKPDFRGASGHRVIMSYGVAALSGVMATLTVIWSLA